MKLSNSIFVPEDIRKSLDYLQTYGEVRDEKGEVIKPSLYEVFRRKEASTSQYRPGLKFHSPIWIDPENGDVTLVSVESIMGVLQVALSTALSAGEGFDLVDQMMSKVTLFLRDVDNYFRKTGKVRIYGEEDKLGYFLENPIYEYGGK